MFALEWVEDITGRKMLICSDSVSSLISIKTGSARAHQGILYEILLEKSKLAHGGKKMVFTWVPAHVGSQGNEKADKMAKEAVWKEEVEMKPERKKQNLQGNN